MALLERLAPAGAPVTIDAIACNPALAGAIVAAGGDSLLAVRGNQASLKAGIARYFATVPGAESKALRLAGKDRDRIGTRRKPASRDPDSPQDILLHPEPRSAGLVAQESTRQRIDILAY